MDSPLSIFTISQIIGIYSTMIPFDISLTNNSFYLLLSMGLLLIVLLPSNEYIGSSILPSNLAMISETLHASLLNMSRQAAGNQAILPLLLGIFGIILSANLISNVPYNYASTSALTVSLGLSFAIFIGVTLSAVSIKGWSFLATFVPSGTPSILLPPLVLIELVSYLARSISLGVRLFANIVAGHTLLGIISSMSNRILFSSAFGLILILVPVGLLVALVGLEIAVSFIQAYVFTILTAIYNDEALRSF